MVQDLLVRETDAVVSSIERIENLIEEESKNLSHYEIIGVLEFLKTRVCENLMYCTDDEEE